MPRTSQDYFDAVDHVCYVSRGFSEQVEYTINPPTFKTLNPRIAMLVCRGWSCIAMLKPQRRHTSAFFLMVPSPEHGTSARTLSNSQASGNLSALWHVTRNPRLATRLTRCVSM